MRYAIYRCLYGEDFVQHSIKSINDYVDKIFIFWDDKCWADVSECVYKGELIKFPTKFDNIIDKIKELNNPKVILHYDHLYNNENQFTHWINDIILPNWKRPDEILFIEIDHVWDDENIKKCISQFKKIDQPYANTRNLELWRTYDYKIPDRGRLSTMFWNMNKIDKMPLVGRHANPINKPLGYLNDGYVCNLGMCFSDEVMYWKHLTAIGFSQKIGEAIPNENWYDKWRTWDYKTNNENLAIALGHENRIPFAEKNTQKIPEILIDEIPEFMKRRWINALER